MSGLHPGILQLALGRVSSLFGFRGLAAGAGALLIGTGELLLGLERARRRSG